MHLINLSSLARYVLMSPFFGSVERAAIESDPPIGVPLTLEATDKLWCMALPVGTTRDHWRTRLARTARTWHQHCCSGAAAGSCPSPRAGRAPQPCSVLRGEAEGDGEGRRASRVQGTDTRFLRHAVDQGKRGIDPNHEAVCKRGEVNWLRVVLSTLS